MADKSEYEQGSLFPKDPPIQKIMRPLKRFLHVEAASGIVLLIATAAGLYLANSQFGPEFVHFWEDTDLTLELGSFRFDESLHHLINDGLMVIFFFVIGLEVKREIVVGELRDLRKASLPIAAALGGMIFPAAIFILFQIGQPGIRGWGIPMATDIAFVVGCMAVLGSRVPHGLRVTVLSLAIADDIGAILVIAVGYTEQLYFNWLATAGIGLLFIRLMAILGVRSFTPYTIVGIVVWFAFLKSGVHATISGVIIGFMTPARSYISTSAFSTILRRADEIFHGDWEVEPDRVEKVKKLQSATKETIPPLEYLENSLHPWVGFVIVPLFAFVNAGVPIDTSTLDTRLTLAVVLGLLIGKPLGIVLASWLAIKLGYSQLPNRVNWGMMVGAGFLAGIGFTMAIFIATLAFQGEEMLTMLNTAKIGVLLGSVLSAVLGMGILILVGAKPSSVKVEQQEEEFVESEENVSEEATPQPNPEAG